MKTFLICLCLCVAVSAVMGIECFECSYTKGNDKDSENVVGTFFGIQEEEECETPDKAGSMADNETCEAKNATVDTALCFYSINNIKAKMNGETLSWTSYSRGCQSTTTSNEWGDTCRETDAKDITAQETLLKTLNLTDVEVTSDGICYCSETRCNSNVAGHVTFSGLALVGAAFLRIAM